LKKAARKQARIDSGQDIIVGWINTDSKKNPLVILDVETKFANNN
jgi:hypothetical protein